MNLLYISPYLTMPQIGAGVGSASHLAAIRECLPKDNITVIALNYTGRKATNLDREYIVINSFNSQIEKVTNILSLNGICMNHRVRKEILSLIENRKIECVFVDESILGKLCRKIKKKFPSIKIISFYHDVKASLCRQWIKEGGVRSLPYNVGLMINENINVEYADKHILLNKREDELFYKYYHRNCDFLLPHFVSKETHRNVIEGETNNSDEIKILFVGVDYHPNVEGVQWFIEMVMPYLKHNISLEIVGKGMERYRDIFARRNVTVIGTVEELSIWYLQADIIVAPIFTGGGMKTKTAEAFQYGKLLIATSESYEGYAENIPDTFWNKLCWRADDVDAYIDILNNLEKNKIKKYNIELRELYEENYSLQAGVNRMKEILDLE